jgi:hypothetical protein
MKERLGVQILVGAVLLAGVGVSTPVSATTSAEVLKDFNRSADVPAGRKILSTKYLGSPRRFDKVEGLVKVEYTGYQVEQVHLFTECGAKVRFVWEVWYRLAGGKWVYATVATWSSEVLNAPPPPPNLDEKTVTDNLKNVIENPPGAQASKVKIESVKLGGQKGGWNNCDPKWEVEATVTFTSGEPQQAMHDRYQCRMVTEMRKTEGQLKTDSPNCFDASGKKMGCHYPDHCKNLGKTSSVAAIAWGPEVESAIKTRMCEGYKDCKAEALTKVSEAAPETRSGSPTRRFTVKWEQTLEDDNLSRSPDRKWKVPARYRCQAQLTIMQAMLGSDWTLKAEEVNLCRQGTSACNASLNSNLDFWKVCDCLQPADHCAQAAKNRANP